MNDLFGPRRKYGNEFLIVVNGSDMELRGSRRLNLWTLYHKTDKETVPDKKYVDMDLESLQQSVKHLISGKRDTAMLLHSGVPLLSRRRYPELINLKLNQKWQVAEVNKTTIYHTNNRVVLKGYPPNKDPGHWLTLDPVKTKKIRKFWHEAEQGAYKSVRPIGYTRSKGAASLWFSDGLPPVDASLMDYVLTRFPQASWLPALEYGRWKTNDHIVVFQDSVLVAVVISVPTKEVPTGIKRLIEK